MSNPLIVYTAISGSVRDKLQAVIAPKDDCGRKARFVCFSDSITESQGKDLGWEVLAPLWRHEDNPSGTARWHKINSHECFPDSPFTLWADGTHGLKVNPWLLVDKYLGATHIATFKHPDRGCVYQELEACVKLKKDKEDVMRAQVSRYKILGYPANNGLFETTVVLRRDTTETRRFNVKWWEEIRDGSLRDQLSMPWVAHKLDFAVNVLPGSRTSCDFYNFIKHR